MKKLTTEEFIEKAQQVHGDKYDYSKVKYENAFKKVIIICPKHGEFLQDPSNHLQGKGCPKCAIEKNSSTRLKDVSEFIKKANKVHNNKYDYSKVDYKGAHKPVCIICPIHGEFYQTPNRHLTGHGCSKCSKVYSWTKEEFLQKAKEIYGNKYDYSNINYVNNKTKVCIICPIHGKFWQTPTLHINGKCGCFKCAAEERGKLKLKTTEQFITEAKAIHGDRYDYSKVNYTGYNSKVEIICPIHGSFFQTPREHLRGAGCQKCLKKGQTKLYNNLLEIFPDKEIIFEATKKIIPWIKSQRIDIYFPDINLAIEYDGKQHFKPIDLFGGQKGFEYTVNQDKIKEKKCEENNCKLFRLRYNYTQSDFLDLVTNIQNIIKNGCTQDSQCDTK